jgi:hypothetical protein
MKVRRAELPAFNAIANRANTLIGELKEAVEFLRKFDDSMPASDAEQRVAATYLSDVELASSEFVAIAKRRFGLEA